MFAVQTYLLAERSGNQQAWTLVMFKRGALVHFAVSQYEVYGDPTGRRYTFFPAIQ